MSDFRCEICGGSLKINDDHASCTCEYCGRVSGLTAEMKKYAEKLEEQSEQKKREEHSKKLFEEEKKEAEKRDTDSRRDVFKSRPISKVILGFMFLCLIVGASSLVIGRPLSGIVALVQAAVFLIAWLMGMQIIKEKKPGLHFVIALIGFLLIIVFFVCGNFDNNIQKENEYNEKIEENKEKELAWPTTGLATMLPTPNSPYGHILYDEPEHSNISIYDVTEEEFKEYRDACEQRGFKNITFDDGDTVYAYNDENYYIELFYKESSKELTVFIEAPEEFNSFYWPNTELAKLVPAPEDKLTNVVSDTDDYFCVHVADVTLDELNSYIDSCIESGFTEDHARDKAYYRAYNRNGEKLVIEYDDRQSIMIININSRE